MSLDLEVQRKYVCFAFRLCLLTKIHTSLLMPAFIKFLQYVDCVECETLKLAYMAHDFELCQTIIIAQ